MISKSFQIETHNLNYNVGISQYESIKSNFRLEELFKLTEKVEKKYQNSIIQFFNDKYILNEHHIYSASYYAFKAYEQKINISNKKSIELILYLSTNRQIKNALDSFGISQKTIGSGKLCSCMIAENNHLESINNYVKNVLNVEDVELDLAKIDLERTQNVIRYFSFSANQINAVLKSNKSKLRFPLNRELSDGEIKLLNDCIHDLICERQSLLSLENVSAY